MTCICSCLLLYSVALRCGANHDLIQQIFILRPCSMVISESRNDHYEAPGIDIWYGCCWEGLLQNSHLTAVARKKCSFCPPPFVHKWDQKGTPPPCLNKRSFYFVDYILRCSRTAKKRFIPKPGTLKISWKGNKNRKPTDSASVPSTCWDTPAPTPLQQVEVHPSPPPDTRKVRRKNLSLSTWNGWSGWPQKKWRSRIQELGEIH